MIRESFPVFAPHTDRGHETPENLEKPGEMGKALLEAMNVEWQESILVAAVSTHVLTKRNALDPKHIKGILRHWKEFPEYLMTVHNSSAPFHFDMDRFGMHQETVDALISARRNVAKKDNWPDIFIERSERNQRRVLASILPMQLAAWVRGSQRIFSLSEEAVKKWESGKYIKTKWGDILMPFDSFLIELQKTQDPLIIEDENRKAIIRGILVTKLSSIDPEYPKGYYEIRLLVTSMKGKICSPTMTKKSRKEAEGIIAGRVSTKHLGTIAKQSKNHGWEPGREGDFRVTEFQPFHLRDDENVTASDVSSLTNRIRQIIAGTCIYLSSKKSLGVEPRPSPTPRPLLTGLTHMNVITDPAEVITIGHVHNFDPDAETEGIEHEGGPKAPHHRRAFLRREAGSPLNAPKTIPVKATVVNRHLLPRDAIPQGTVTKL